MVEPFIIILSLVVFLFLLRPLAIDSEELYDPASVFSIIVLVLSLLVYFYGVDPFPSSLPFGLGVLHILTIAMINAVALFDVAFQIIFGVPLTMNFIFFILIPAGLTYRLSHAMLSYVGVLSDRTVGFICLVLTFLTIKLQFNPLAILFAIFGAIAGLFGRGLVSDTISFFLVAVLVLALGIFLEVMTLETLVRMVEGPADEREA